MFTSKKPVIYIGYDEREKNAFEKYTTMSASHSRHS